MPLFSPLTLRNSAMLEKYFWLASATFFSAACGFTISRPWAGEKDKKMGGEVASPLTMSPPTPTPCEQAKQRKPSEEGAFLTPAGKLSRYLEWCEGHAGGGPRGAVPDGGLPTIYHTLLLQGPLWGEGRYQL